MNRRDGLWSVVVFVAALIVILGLAIVVTTVETNRCLAHGGHMVKQHAWSKKRETCQGAH